MFPVVAKPVVCPIYRVRGRLTGRAAPISGHQATLATPHPPPSIRCRSSAGHRGQVRGLDAAGQPYRDAQFIHTTGPQPESRTGCVRPGDHPSIACHSVVGGPHTSRLCFRGRPHARQVPRPQPRQPRSSFNARRWKSGSPMACWAMSHAPSAPSLPCEILARPSIPFDQLP